MESHTTAHHTLSFTLQQGTKWHNSVELLFYSVSKKNHKNARLHYNLGTISPNMAHNESLENFTATLVENYILLRKLVKRGGGGGALFYLVCVALLHCGGLHIPQGKVY